MSHDYHQGMKNIARGVMLFGALAFVSGVSECFQKATRLPDGAWQFNGDVIDVTIMAVMIACAGYSMLAMLSIGDRPL